MSTLKLHANNLEVTRHKNPYSELSSATDAGATSSIVLNSVGFVAGDYLLMGEINGEETELVVLNSVSGNTLNHDATSFDHPASTPIFLVPYNQIRFYRLRSGVETLIGTIDMQPGSSKYSTDFYGEAQTGDQFATSYYNANNGSETQKSEWVTMNGYAGNSKYGMAIRAAKLFQDKDNKIIDDTTWFEWQHEAIGQLIRKAQDKDQGYTLASTATITDATELTAYDATSFPLPTDFRVMKRIWVNYTGDDYAVAYPEDVQDASPSDSFSESTPFWSFDGDNVIVRPGDATQIQIKYYPVVTELADNADTPARPIADYDHVIINYMLMRAFAYARNEEWSANYKTLWNEGVGEMLDEIDKRQRDKPRKIVHPNPLLAYTRDGGGYI